MPTQNDIGLNYIIFNDLWDTIVNNQLNQSLENRDEKLVKNNYLNYLKNALKTLKVTHQNIRVTIWLVELTRYGLNEYDIRNIINSDVNIPYFTVFKIPYDRIKNYIENALASPSTIYRSPNELHEFLLLQIIKLSNNNKVAIMDPDTLFISSNALNQIFDKLESDESKWIGSIIEKGVIRPFQDTQIDMRQRMHSVALFIMRDRFINGFINNINWNISPNEKIKLIKNEECRDYYLKYKIFDTLSLLTDLLKYSFDVDRILELNPIIHSVEGKKLTITSDLLIHCKYLDGFSNLISDFKSNIYIREIFKTIE